MTDSKVAVLKERLDRVTDDIMRHEERLSAVEKGHNAILIAIAQLPTKQDLKDYSDSVCGRIDKQDIRLDNEKKRIDGLYLRDGVGSLITGLLGLVGIISK